MFEGRGWIAIRLGLDLAALAGASVIAAATAPAAPAGAESVFTIAFVLLAVAALAARGMYSGDDQVGVLDGARHVVAALAIAAISAIAVATLTQEWHGVAGIAVNAWLVATGLIVAERVALIVARRSARANRLVSKSTLIVGAGLIGAQVEHRLNQMPELGLVPVGFIDPDPVPDGNGGAHREAPVLGSPDELIEVARATGVRHVIFAFVAGPDSALLPLLRRCEEQGIETSVVPRLFESTNTRVGLHHVGGLPLFRLRPVNPRSWQFAIKHASDRVLAPLMMLLLSPLILGLAIAVKLSSPGPVLFRQRRIGRDGREFDILKFRSMRLEHPNARLARARLVAEGRAPGGVEGPDRRTGVGRLMRRFSLDELPQLVNVIKGEMSVVGPRPERPEFVELFGRDVRRYDDRHRVKSGITGWAQVHGLRGQTPLGDRVEWDNYYIENWSLWLDVKIMLMTFGAVRHRAE